MGFGMREQFRTTRARGYVDDRHQRAMRQVVVRLEAAEFERWASHAHDNNMAFANLIREALRQYRPDVIAALERPEPPRKTWLRELDLKEALRKSDARVVARGGTSIWACRYAP